MSQERSAGTNSLEDVPVVNTEELPATWREAPRGWGHSMHKLAPYVGGYPPSLAYYFITKYTKKHDTVLDPFCGGGTTPFEALRLGRHAIGNDAFSYAYTLTHAKCKPLNRDGFVNYLDNCFDQAKALPDSKVPAADSDVEIFYHPDTLDTILRLKEVLRDDNSRSAIFLKALMCGILHGPSERFLSVQTKDTFSGTPDYVRKYKKENDLEPENRDVRKRLVEKYEAVTEDELPLEAGEVYQRDSRDLQIADESTDFVLTSPPYMHVLDYTWNNWLRLWWLDEDKDKERDELVITSDQEKYKEFILDTLNEIYRVLTPNSRAVIVIGDVKKRLAAGTKKVRVGQIIATQAKKAGFDVESVIDDAYGIEKRSYKKFNEIRYEEELEDDSDDEELIDRCIVLTKGYPAVNNEVTPDW